jgi:hypothetical protein
MLPILWCSLDPIEGQRHRFDTFLFETLYV